MQLGQGFSHLSEKKGKTLFVTNSHVVAVDMPLLITHISGETGMNVRTVAKSYQTPTDFRIPFWKHALEFLGCVPDLPDVIRALLEKGSPMLIYSDLEKGLIDHDLVSKALQHGYTVVPISTVGCSDAFKVLATLPEQPILNYLGLETSSEEDLTITQTPTATATQIADFETLTEQPKSSPEPLATTVPVIAPYVSPQALYLRVGQPITLEEGGQADHNALMRLQALLDESMKQGIKECREMQGKDPQRYLTAAGSVFLRRRRRRSLAARMRSF
ncbi:hypothetical protein HDU67_001738 [Dinochytrium kinnereticum]|nr:hypothetical protein HDU67_001738 [Dinochytrium kinnereticum]